MLKILEQKLKRKVRKSRPNKKKAYTYPKDPNSAGALEAYKEGVCSKMSSYYILSSPIASQNDKGPKNRRFSGHY